MINPGLNVNKYFRYQLEKCMYTTFGETTQPFIKNTLLKKYKISALLIFHNERGENSKKPFIFLSCAIYSIIENYVCIDYLACQ